jgi:3-hydroxyacyl-[acyl-carrier-protein] dehydratase
MLVPGLYETLSASRKEQKISAMVELDKSHRIYEGHFPGQPVLPGVLQVQIIREILEEQLKTGVILESASNIKFMSMIDPGRDNVLEIHIEIQSEEDRQINIRAEIRKEKTVFFIFKGMFRVL